MKAMRGLCRVSMGFCLAVFAAAPAARAVEFHGFVQGNFDARTADRQPAPASGTNYLLVDERLQLELSQRSADGTAGAFFKADFFHDGVANKNDIEVREGYMTYAKGAVDLRAGRQIVTWGTGDLLFINDIFPKNYAAFYSGRPLEYLKNPVDGLKLALSSELLSGELVAMPSFDANTYPDPARFYLFDPFAAVAARTTLNPVRGLDDTQMALRLYRYFGATDVSVYAYKGFSPAANARPNSFVTPAQITYFYPELAVYGASATGSILYGIGNVEFGYDDSRQNRRGLDPAIENSRWKAMAGYKKELWEDFTAGVQYYAEIMESYGHYLMNLPAGMPARKRALDYATLRLTQLFWYQTLRLSYFHMYSPADNDFLANPEASYKMTDEFTFALGANIFSGAHNYTAFGQLRRDSNVYTYLRYQF